MGRVCRIHGDAVIISVIILLRLCFGQISAKWAGNIDDEPAQNWLNSFQDNMWHLTSADDGEDEASARQWLAQANEEMARRNNLLVQKEWNYDTNLTDENANAWSDENVRMTSWFQEQKRVASSFHSDKFDPDVKRQLKLFTVTSANPSDKDKVIKLSEIMSRMEGIFGKAKVCPRESKCVSLNPELERIMEESRDPEELKWAWLKWRDVTGPKLKPLYEEMTYLQNLGAKENGYANTGAYWRLQNYEAPDIEPIVDRLYEQVKPLYMELYIYVRRKLIEQYKDALEIRPDAPMPAHLLGNMWAQEWTAITDLVLPFPEASDDDVTATMHAQAYTPMRMFKMAEEFFTSIGLFKMSPTFWQKSVIVKPSGREIQCHAAASDFHSTDDWRIRMCTKVNQADLMTIHHEMGHIEYYMAYSLQPDIYRAGANTAFHEAIGDTIALSVSSQKHMETVGLLEKKDTADESDTFKREINNLMRIALEKIAFLPFGYLIDKWRWKVYAGEITPDNYNRAWWEMRLQYQGLVPPVTRSERDFDPASKYHVATNVPYIRYFISFIAQFQFYEALCIESGHVAPLHQCDFYKSKVAGKKLKDMLSLGFSKPWPEALKVLTGQSEINTSSIRRYFTPLMDWLVEQNRDDRHDWLPDERTPQSVIDDFFE